MRLAAKLVLLFLVGLLLIVGLFAYLTIRQDRELAIAEHERYASDLAATIEPSLRDAIANRDAVQLQQIVSRSTRSVRHARVRLVEIGAPSRTDSHGTGDTQPTVPRSMIVTTEEVTTISMPDPSGTKFLYTYVPIRTGTDAAAESIEVSAPDTEATNWVRRSLLSSILALLGVATLSGVVILIGGVAMVGRPLNQLIEKVERIGQGDFGSPIKVKSNDELGSLATAINTMCAQLASQRERLEAETESRIEVVQQLRHSDRLSSVGRLAAGLAHEIGTPLNVISGRAELITSGQLSSQSVADSASAIKMQSDRITKTVRELLDFARQSTPHRTEQSLVELIERTVHMAKPLAAKQNVTLAVHLPGSDLAAELDSSQIQQVLMNLIVNAIQVLSEEDQTDSGRIDITLSDSIAQISQAEDSRAEDSGTRYRTIAICDNGNGIAKQDLPHIFEPFFTTKDIGRGTGLGLSISHGIVQEHDGWIDVESSVGEGSCFTIHLPAKSSKRSPQHNENADES
ncbi:Wide host range VirA protein [Planctomycetes bacterium CA13]|uniref:histidine kinase n=1 Tax=Novipirellula herctigrandis TaxID=2527986 RepID=A0A5C5Z0V5_9BACT|nr:Wide host range VirA protein [Planctomycetes bacterium CA13]